VRVGAASWGWWICGQARNLMFSFLKGRNFDFNVGQLFSFVPLRRMGSRVSDQLQVAPSPLAPSVDLKLPLSGRLQQACAICIEEVQQQGGYFPQSMMTNIHITPN
jgi:hypothetical protein